MSGCCKRVVILDFETTGLSGDRDRVIEVGAVALDGKKVAGNFSQLMDPGDFLPYQITQITGITDEMLSGKPSPEEVMPELKEFIGDRIVIAHNAGFDQKFLHAEMRRAGYKFQNPFLCTLKLSRRLIPSLNSYSLTSLKGHLDISVEQSHRALDDAKATVYVWRHLYEVVSELSGVKTPELELMQKLMDVPKARIPKFLESLS